MIPKSEKNTRKENYKKKRKLQIHIPNEYRFKKSHQNTNRIQQHIKRIIYHHNHVEFIDMPR